MKTVVITGGTRGIGYGMAWEFLKRDCQVVICGRSSDSTQAAVQTLAEQFGSDYVLGQPCDVSDYSQVQVLWDAAIARFGTVDIWVNNAGLSHPPHQLWQIDAERTKAVVDTNMLGLIYCNQIVISAMNEQGHGFIYNMEGSGSSGRPMPTLLLYQLTKRALKFMTDGLVKATKDMPVNVCYLSPGIVITDLLMEGYTDAELERVKRIFNILGDKVETVTPYLVEEMLKNDQHGARIAWLKTPGIIWRFLTSPFNKRDLFS